MVFYEANQFISKLAVMFRITANFEFYNTKIFVRIFNTFL